MGAYRQEFWPGNLDAVRAKDRRQGHFDAYIPHPISEWQPTLPADLVAYAVRTEQMLGATASASAPNSGIAGMFFWAESLGSSRIEGVNAPARKVVHAIVSESTPSPQYRKGAVGEALGNIDAVHEALRIIADPSSLRLEDIRDAHVALMRPSPSLGGAVKTTQNWIGGNDWHPLEGDFVPPPPDAALPLMNDLVAYLRTSDHTPILKSALSHAQFETIHPFGDGNGRTGRAILYAILKHECAPDGFMPPVSLALSSSRENYMDALRAFQEYVGPPDDPQRSDALCHIVESISVAARRSCTAARDYAEAAKRLQTRWLKQIGGRRERSAVSAAIQLLPSRPSLTPTMLSDISGYSRKRCASALLRLDEAGITRKHTIGPNLRVHDAAALFDMYQNMSDTIGDPEAAKEGYDHIIASVSASRSVPPAAGTLHSQNQPRQHTGWTICPKKVTSTGRPCGLHRNHRGHCRTLPNRRQPPRRR